MIFIDTHTHLYLNEFVNDIDDVIEKARNVGITKFYLPSIDSEHHENLLRLEASYPKECFPMMGLHPCSVKENYLGELQIVENFFNKRQFCAIGEIGLDFYWDVTFKEQQLIAFNMQMDLALQYSLPIVIHTRNAMKETIQTVKPYSDQGLTGIFHCFGDSEDFANQIINMGFYLGIGGVVTYKKANLEESLKNIPLEKMVLETDAPYLTPVPYRGKRNESSYLLHIAQRLAEIKKVTIEEVAAITTENAKKIFG